MFLLKMIMLQSHARAIHHSDRISLSRTKCLTSVTIPRSGNPSFRPLCKIPLAWSLYGYNPTLGQSIIPTGDKAKYVVSRLHVTIPRSGNPSFRPYWYVSASTYGYGYNPTLGQSIIPTLPGGAGQYERFRVTIPRSGNPSFRRSCRGGNPILCKVT